MHLVKKPVVLLAVVPASFLFVFATAKNSSDSREIPTSTANVIEENHSINLESTSALFADLHLDKVGMKQTVFNSALQGLQKLSANGEVKRSDIVTIIDFSQPSNKKRLYVLDLENKQILFNTLVAHGRNSGKLWAKSFSNNASSLRSSPGFYVTAGATS